MADIDNMRGDTLRVVEENTLDNMRGVTQRVISENSIDNTRGVTYRVYNVNPAPAPVIDELNVTPSTSAQIITAPEGTDGYSPVNVTAVTSSIDANIVAGNIKKDVNILGVTGSYEGNVPTGTMYIISNGTYNVADKAIANVQVPTTAPDYYIAFSKNASNVLQTPDTFIDLTGVKDISAYALYYKFYNSTITSVDFKDVETVSGNNACNCMCTQCTQLTTIIANKLKTISGPNAFSGAFQTNTALEYVEFAALETISGQNAFATTFTQCLNIKEVRFPKLYNLSGNGAFGMFAACFTSTKLENVYFNNLKSSSTFSSNALSMLFNTSVGSAAPNGCTVHFPSNLDPNNGSTVISSLTGYPTFGGNSSYIHLSFDLPATE